MDTQRAILIYLYSKRRASLDDLVKDLKLDRVEATNALYFLESQGLVRTGSKGLIFKKKVYELTPKGLEEASKAYSELQAKAEKLNELTEGGKQLDKDSPEVKDLGMTPLDALLMAMLGLLTVESIAALGMIGLLEAEPFPAQAEGVEADDDEPSGSEGSEVDIGDYSTDQNAWDDGEGIRALCTVGQRSPV